jgi:hypothetical protein
MQLRPKCLRVFPVAMPVYSVSHCFHLSHLFRSWNGSFLESELLLACNSSVHMWHIFKSIGCETKGCLARFDEPRGTICKDCEICAEVHVSTAQWRTSPVGGYSLASWGDPYRIDDLVNLHKSYQNYVNWEAWPDHLLDRRSSHPFTVRKSIIWS